MPDPNAEIIAQIEKLAERIQIGMEIEHPLTPKQMEAVQHAVRQQWALEHTQKAELEQNQTQSLQHSQEKATDQQAEKTQEQPRENRPSQERDRGR